MIVLGLTGSIGMGKSTVSTMMKTLNIPVHDADACVHDLLSPQNSASLEVAAAFPYFEFPDLYDKKTKGLIRKELGQLVFNNDEYRAKLEGILHPLVHKSQSEFIKHSVSKGRDIVCLDIPLLYETNAQERVDYVIVVTTPSFIQRTRVLARPNMDEGKFGKILSQQVPDHEKRVRADYVIKNGLNRAHTMKQLKVILQDVRKKVSPSDKEIKDMPT